MYRHFKDVSTAGVFNTKLLAKSGKLQTAEEQTKTYVFDKNGKVLSLQELTPADITTVCFTMQRCSILHHCVYSGPELARQAG